MYKLILFSIILCCYSCNNQTKVVHYFDEYTYFNKLKKAKSIICTINTLGESEKRVVYEGGDTLIKFRDEFLERTKDSIGIYRKFDKEYILNYRIDSIGRGVYNIKGRGSHFFFPNIIFAGKKEYSINNTSYLVYKYSEYSGSFGINSYYLKDFGFIAYDLTKRYFLCTHFSGRENLSSENLKIIGQKLVNDSTFFSISTP